MGNIRSHSTRWRRNTVHPHSRGEHLGIGATNDTQPGSSPLAWGTYSVMESWARLQRFIPTRVGNIAILTAVDKCITVHPHSRGEHLKRRGQNNGGRGSSPLAWGTSVSNHPRRAPGRFIPTRVGNMRCLRNVELAARFIPTRVGNMMM